MSTQERRNEWLTVAAIALIALGVWFLLGNVVPFWGDLVDRISKVAGPLLLIALGVLLYLSAKRGGAGGRRLYRSTSDRMVGGVLAGFANYLGVEPIWVRLGYVLVAIATNVFPAILAYVIAMVVVPEEPAMGSSQPTVWPTVGEQRVGTPPSPTSGWPHTTGTETVQTPPPAPPSPPAAPGPPDAEPPGEHEPVQSR